MSNETPDQANAKMFEAIDRDDVVLLKQALADGADPNQLSDGAESPLYSAAAFGQNECIEVLLEAGADINARLVLRRSTGMTIRGTALGCAINNIHVDTAGLLLGHGADPRVPDMGLNTAAHLLASVIPRLLEDSVNRLMTRILDTGLPINQLNASLQTVLMKAVREKGRASTVKLLLDRGADPNAMDFQGMRPIHFVFDASQLETLELLLQSGVHVDSTTAHGRTALSFFRDVEVGEELVRRGANVNHKCDTGRNALLHRLDSATGNTAEGVLQFLLSSGLDIDEPDYAGDTVIKVLGRVPGPDAQRNLAVAMAFRARNALRNAIESDPGRPRLLSA